jgi:hypothetical protein
MERRAGSQTRKLRGPSDRVVVRSGEWDGVAPVSPRIGPLGAHADRVSPREPTGYPGDHREHSDGQRVGDREQAAARSRAVRPSGSSGAGLARLLLCQGGGAARANAEAFTPDCLLNAQPGGHRAVGCGGSARLGRAELELPSSTESGFSLLAPKSGARGAGVIGCYGRLDVPDVYLFCTLRVPVMRLGLLFRWSWPCPAAARQWSANRSHLHAARAWGHLCLERGRRFRPLPGGTALGGPSPRRACRLPVQCARAGALPAIEPWRGRWLDNHREDVAT